MRRALCASVTVGLSAGYRVETGHVHRLRRPDSEIVSVTCLRTWGAASWGQGQILFDDLVRGQPVTYPTGGLMR